MTQFEGGRLFELQCEARDPDLAAARACRLLAKVSAAERDDYWLAEIDPPLRGQAFGLGARDISEIIVATRLSGQSLFDIRHFPIPVYVARITDPSVAATRTLRPDQIELILWGDLRPLA
jgi:hypothetical protein